MGVTTIEWTDKTWGPVKARHKKTGKVFYWCVKVSPGCLHCYAESLGGVWFGMPAYIKHNRDEVEFFLDEKALLEPLHWRKPCMVFVESCSDLFGDWVTVEWLERISAVMEATPEHTYQVLTKRSERMLELLRSELQSRATGQAGVLHWAAQLPNVWWGLSVEDRQHGLPRLEQLRQTPAQVRFLSIEPLLEDLGEINLSGIHWVIVGGESGNGARPMHRDWVESIRRQCEQQGVLFFFKQWGGKNKKAAGRELNGRTYDDKPERYSLPLIQESLF